MDPENLSARQAPEVAGVAPTGHPTLLRRVRLHLSGLELWSAILLSLATLTSAWCAYQSALWGGIQTMLLAEANGASRTAQEKVIEGGQQRLMDITLFLQYMMAQTQADTTMTQFLTQRFRPEMQEAFEAWQATNPQQNRNAPAHPFVMDEYSLPTERDARALSGQAAIKFHQAQQANLHSDLYVLLTVICASVLFFGGIATKFPSPTIQTVVVVIGFLLWMGCMGYMLLKMPVATAG